MASTAELNSAFDSETFSKDGSFEIDRPVGSASISPCGRDIVLASRHGLDIIDLDSPYAPPRHLSHQTPWEVADAQWSPFAARDYWIVSTSNQKALVWNVGIADPQSSIEHTLHGHKRAITDINFSAHHPDILSTCAVDSFIHCWDLRRPSKPAMTFCDWFAGATQVKWNRQDAHILASSHDKYLKIWDDRKGAHPVKTIMAHSTKIYGVDWDRIHPHNVATCSLDRTIKLWDYHKETDQPEQTITTPFPVWRARHTPFGTGLVALPQRGSFDLHMYDWNSPREAESLIVEDVAHRFVGHRAPVKEFLWRTRGNVAADVDERDFQLVSWGNDKVLRLHEMKDAVLEKVGYRKGMSIKRAVNFTRRGARYRSFRDKPHSENHEEGEPGLLGISSKTPAMMSRGRSVNTTGYGSEGFMSSVANKKSSANELDPVTWMRGVRIGKRAFSPSATRSSEVLLPPEPKIGPQWDTFETLGEEITASLDKFPNVRVDTIDVQRRTITISLPTTASRNGSTRALTCRLDFPVAYPDAAMPSLAIQNFSSFEADHTQVISEESAELLKTFLKHKQHSLEGLLRYLLGEQSLREAINWLEKPRETPFSRAFQDLSSSSDDEDEALEGLTRPLSKDMEGSGTLPPSSSIRYNIPLPNSCGARWTSTGLLVCFFLPKIEQEPSFFDHSLGMHSRYSNGSKDIFGGLGRSQRIRSKTADSYRGKLGGDDSGSDDFELSSSSDSSSSLTDFARLSHPFMPSRRWNGMGSGLLQDSRQDNSQKSVIDAGQTRHASTAISKHNAIISIKDLAHFQPANLRLATSYRMDVSPAAARHNAALSHELGYDDLKQTWTLCGMILDRMVQLKSTGGFVSGGKPSRHSWKAHSGADSAVDISFDIDAGLTSREHDFLADRGDFKVERWLVAESFRRYERQGNVQMLATLSCVLDLPDIAPPRFRHSMKPKPDVDRTSQITIQLNSSNHAEAEQQSAEVSLWKTALENQFNHQTQSSKSLSILPKKFQQPLSSSVSPPEAKLYRNESLSKPLLSSSLSSSPEDSRMLRRTSSALSTFAIPFTRPLQSTQFGTSSPPNKAFRKRTDPADGSFDSNQSSVIWQPSQWLSKSSFESQDTKSIISPTKTDSFPQPKDGGHKLLRTVLKMKNQHRFRHNSVLDCTKRAQHYAWRRAYADILSAWDLPVQRAEIDKVNQGPPSLSDENACLLQVPTSASTYPTQSDALCISVLCSKCGLHQSTRHGNNNRFKCTCQNGHQRTTPPPICTLCLTYIYTLSSPCLACGHTMHLHCRSLHAQYSDVLHECPTGCGCDCSQAQQQVVIPTSPGIKDTQSTKLEMVPPPLPPRPPRRESTPLMQELRSPLIDGDSTDNSNGTITPTTSDGKEKRERGKSEDASAYLSLARTLERKQHREGSFGLRATASQIWRGGGSGAGSDSGVRRTAGGGRGDGKGVSARGES